MTQLGPNWNPTGETCDVCGLKLYRNYHSGARKCRNGHAPGADTCDDCGEEVLSHPSLGGICGCEG